VTALANEIREDPVLFPMLQILNTECDHFSTT
jgi:hypothetical protein